MFTFSGNPLCILGNLYALILLVRAVFSWFPIRSDSPLVAVTRFLNLITEPVLAPFRKIIPPVGMLDLSFLVAFLAVELVTVYILCRL